MANICPSCGFANKRTNTRCSSCHAPLQRNKKKNNDDAENASNFTELTDTDSGFGDDTLSSPSRPKFSAASVEAEKAAAVSATAIADSAPDADTVSSTPKMPDNPEIKGENDSPQFKGFGGKYSAPVVDADENADKNESSEILEGFGEFGEFGGSNDFSASEKPNDSNNTYSDLDGDLSSADNDIAEKDISTEAETTELSGAPEKEQEIRQDVVSDKDAETHSDRPEKNATEEHAGCDAGETTAKPTARPVAKPFARPVARPGKPGSDNAGHVPQPARTVRPKITDEVKKNFSETETRDGAESETVLKGAESENVSEFDAFNEISGTAFASVEDNGSGAESAENAENFKDTEDTEDALILESDEDNDIKDIESDTDNIESDGFVIESDKDCKAPEDVSKEQPGNFREMGTYNSNISHNNSEKAPEEVDLSDMNEFAGADRKRASGIIAQDVPRINTSIGNSLLKHKFSSQTKKLAEEAAEEEDTDVEILDGPEFVVQPKKITHNDQKDGFYNDVLPYDFNMEEGGGLFENIDKEMMKKVGIVVGAAILIIAGLIFGMYKTF